MATDKAREERALFQGGPLLNLLHRVGVARLDTMDTWRLVAIAVLVAWIPLLVLTMLDMGAFKAFLADFSVHAKYLVALPALLIADVACAPRLGAIARHFARVGLVEPADRPKFDAAIDSTARLRDSTLAMVGVLVLSYAVVAALVLFMLPADLAVWHRSPSAFGSDLSLAGWWLFIVSLPLLLTVVLGWAWRWFLWTRFLWLVSKLDLALVASHADGTGGLKFVAHSVRACWPLGLAFGVIAAGSIADEVVHQGAALLDYKYLVVEAVTFSVVFIAAPLLVFSLPLLRAWRRGVFEYGALAERCGRELERKWIESDENIAESLLEHPDFTTTIDLYGIVDRVHSMRLVPIDVTSLVMLAVATMVPFVPVVLMAIPLDTVLDRIAHLLL